MNREKQILDFLNTFEGTYKEKRKIAKQFKIDVPPPELSEQIKEAYLKFDHVAAKAEEGTHGKNYAVVPALYLDDKTITRETWVRLEVARQVGEALIRLANEAENK